MGDDDVFSKALGASPNFDLFAAAIGVGGM
jgi:hypothetical protein